MPTPEDKAREKIDSALEKSGWKVQDTKAANLGAGRGVALRNSSLTQCHGFSEGQLQAIHDLHSVTETYFIRVDHLRSAVLMWAFRGKFMEG